MCLAGANETYETVLSAWDENVLRLAADEQEQLREEALKAAAQKRGEKVSAAADAF